MSPDLRLKLARRVAFAAGCSDFSAGLGLLVAPALTLGLMGIATPGEEALVQVRFVGAFVTGVGVCYLLALAQGETATLRALLTQTLVLRLCAGGYVGAAWSLGWLEAPWLAVTATDFGWVVVQAVLLVKGLTHHD